ncbi:FGGY-family carbohydrate kinase [Rahnella sikkimica]|uniref:FGGY-family carbohydrate kinase n=1 Tax=Rahnella sikkimica TaxID=1805933 RepID=UPI00210154F9|nr:FGGY-family carbohydrate kinase [Rahnella sikkimica]
MDKMADELGVPFKRLIISGGGANNDLFMQIFADVYQKMNTHLDPLLQALSLLVD